MKHRILMLGVTTLSVALSGCSGGDGTETDTESAGQTSACASEDRAEPYERDMSKTGDNGMSIQISDATPAPPERYDNSWMLVVTDADGEPVSGATVEVTPEMPDHGHGAPVTPIVSDVGDGMYEVERIRLSMPGYWEIRVDVQGETLSDKVTYKFCVE